MITFGFAWMDFTFGVFIGTMVCSAVALLAYVIKEAATHAR